MNARISIGRAPCFLLPGAILGTALFTGIARAEPVPGGLVIARGAACRVLVAKVSYDDPGADDAEFIELVVERTAAQPARGSGGGNPEPSPPCLPVSGAGGTSSGDSGTPPAADAGSGARALTLGDCGLLSLELVNGGGGACEAYRVLPLAALPVPADDRVTFCATDSTLAAVGCDVMAAGRSALRNGWLQNGPADGIRFRAGDGSVALELAYEGRVECFGSNEHADLVDETGQAPGSTLADAADDVNTFCDDRFVLLSPAAAPLRGDVTCPSRSLEPFADAASGGTGFAPGAAGSDAGFAAIEHAPDTRPRGPTSIHAALGRDAGLVAIERAPSDPPAPPGCSTTPGNPAARGRAAGIVVAVFLGFRRRKRPSRPRRR